MSQAAPNSVPRLAPRLGERIVAILLGPWLWLYLAGLGIGSLAWNLIAMLLLPVLPEAAARRIGRAAIAYGYRFFWFCTWLGNLVRIHVEDDLSALGAEPHGLVIAANHPSALDALAIIACLPRAFCVMKASLMRNPCLGAGARLARYASNDSPRDMLQIAEEVRRGGHLVLFPEGTRTVDGRLNRFLPGVSTIAQRANVPIQTIIIEAESPYLGKGWPIWKSPPKPIVFRLRLGRRFEPDPDHAGQLARLEAYFRRELGA